MLWEQEEKGKIRGEREKKKKKRKIEKLLGPNIYYLVYKHSQV